MRKVISLVCLLIILMISLILLSRVYTLCLTNENNAANFFDATIYNNVQYDLGGSGIKLTEQGVDITSWNYSNSKYLKIITNLPSDLVNSNKKMVIGINLPKEFYFSVNDFLLPPGCSKVEFKKNDNFAINTNSNYNVNSHSGTVFYTINPGVTSITIQLEVKYDFDLWDKLDRSLINQKDQKSIEVKLYESNDVSLNMLTQKSINNCYSDSAYQIVSGIYDYVDNNRFVNTEVQMLYGDRNKKKLKSRLYIISKSQNAINMFYKELKFKIKLPEYIDSNNVKHYLTIDKTDLEINLDTRGTPDYSIDESDISNGNVVISLKNVYLTTKYERTLFFKYIVPEISGLKEDSIIRFSEVLLKTDVLDNMGVERNLTSTSYKGVVFFMKPTENVDVIVRDRRVSYRTGMEKGVTYLGGGVLTNRGTADSSEKCINVIFDSENTGYIQVTTMTLPIDKEQKDYDVRYRLIDKNNNLVYKDEHGNYISDNEKGRDYWFSVQVHSLSTGDPNKINFARSMLPEEERKYFFKEIKYNIPKIKSGMTFDNYNSVTFYNGIGDYFGYVNYKNKDKKVVYSNFKVSGNDSKYVEKRIPTYILQLAQSQYMISDFLINNKDKNSEVIAGNSINIGANVNVISFPYGNLNWINNIVIGVVLPNGITIDNNSIVMKTINNNNIRASKIEKVDLYNGNVLWKIYPQSELTIGFAKEDYNFLDNGAYLKFEMLLNIDNSVEGQTINLNKVLYVASEKKGDFDPIYNNAAGSYSWAKKVDKYDLNGDGNINDYIGGGNESNKLGFKVIPQNEFFTVKDSINVNDGSESGKVDILNKDDLINYKLSLKFNDNVNFSRFAYYVPITKKSSINNNYMIKTENGIFDLALQGPVTMSDDSIYIAEYTFDKGITNENINNVNWVLADKVTDFNNVTMVKIIQKKAGLINGSKTDINFKLKYLGHNFEEETGKRIEFRSAGGLRYSVNGNVTDGIFPTNGVSVRIKTVKELPDITLTAAPNRRPEVMGDSNFASFDTKRFVGWNNLHKLRIINIETNNVVLKSKDDINNNLDIDGNIANNTFGINLSVNNKSVDLIQNADFTKFEKDFNFGSGISDVWEYNIYNGNNLSDNVTDRYIVITYESDKGLILKQKIIINREIRKAISPTYSIVTGYRYRAFDEQQENIGVNKKSSVTMQFVLNYIPNFYSDQKLKFNKKLPVGTKITFYDYVKDSNPTYWYYKVDRPVDFIDISEFNKMGYTNKKYGKLDESNFIKEVYMFVFDFKDAEIADMDNITTMLEMNSTKVEKYFSKELITRFYPNYSFDLGKIVDTQNINNDINLSYNVNLFGEGINYNTYFNNKKLSYVITTDEDFPSDAYMESKNGSDIIKYFRNSKNQFIISAGDMSEYLNNNRKFKFIVNGLLAKKKYNLKIDLMASATSDGDSPFGGDILATKNVILENNNISPAIEILEMNDRVISNSDLSKNQVIRLRYLKTDGVKLTIELQKKIGNDYNTLPDKLISVNGNTINNNGVFGINLNNGDNDLSLKFLNDIGVGTYRLLFKVIDDKGNTIYEVPYGFIIKDGVVNVK